MGPRLIEVGLRHEPTDSVAIFGRARAAGLKIHCRPRATKASFPSIARVGVPLSDHFCHSRGMRRSTAAGAQSNIRIHRLLLDKRMPRGLLCVELVGRDPTPRIPNCCLRASRLGEQCGRPAACRLGVSGPPRPPALLPSSTNISKREIMSFRAASHAEVLQRLRSDRRLAVSTPDSNHATTCKVSKSMY